MDEYNLRYSIRKNEESIVFESNNIKMLERKLEDLYFFRKKCSKRHNQLELFIYDKQSQYRKLREISDVRFYSNTSTSMLEYLGGNKYKDIQEIVEYTLKQTDNKINEVEKEIALSRTRITSFEDVISNLYYDINRLG